MENDGLFIVIVFRVIFIQQYWGTGYRIASKIVLLLSDDFNTFLDIGLITPLFRPYSNARCIIVLFSSVSFNNIVGQTIENEEFCKNIRVPKRVK